jgi:hypothetical protein
MSKRERKEKAAYVEGTRDGISLMVAVLTNLLNYGSEDCWWVPDGDIRKCLDAGDMPGAVRAVLAWYRTNILGEGAEGTGDPERN